MKFECMLIKTDNGGKTQWTPDKPEAGISVGDEVTFGSREGVWSVHFAESPFDNDGIIRDFGGKANEKEMAIVARAGDFMAACGLSINGVPIIAWNGSSGNGDPIKTVNPPAGGN